MPVRHPAHGALVGFGQLNGQGFEPASHAVKPRSVSHPSAQHTMSIKKFAQTVLRRTRKDALNNQMVAQSLVSETDQFLICAAHPRRLNKHMLCD
jgi:hypothetical protein